MVEIEMVKKLGMELLCNAMLHTLQVDEVISLLSPAICSMQVTATLVGVVPKNSWDTAQ